MTNPEAELKKWKCRKDKMWKAYGVACKEWGAAGYSRDQEYKVHVAYGRYNEAALAYERFRTFLKRIGAKK